MNQSKLGGQLRRLRQLRQMSVRTLAARSGFSPSFISQVEADQVSPSIASLEKIVGQLGVSLAQLFSSLELPQRTIIRAAERMIYRSDWSHSSVEAITDAAADRALSAVLVTFDHGGSSATKPTPSWHDTIAYVLTGVVTLTLESGDYRLEAGDTAYLQEGDAFTLRNDGDEQASVLLVSASGTNNGLSAHRDER
jgi:transcriptional regulator with XRE-family HTH domain